MPTNRELEERVEELELERERILSEAESERIELEGRLTQSELHADHLQRLLTALTSGQQSLTANYDAEVQRLLGRVREESRRMAAIHAQWTKKETELEGTIKGLRKNLDEAGRLEAAAQRKVREYRGELERVTAAPPDWERIRQVELEEKQKIIDQLVQQYQKLDAQLAALPLPEPTLVQELLAMLRNNPRVYVMTISLAITLGFFYLILRLILPSSQ